MDRDESFAAMMNATWEFNLRDLCRWGHLLTAGKREFGISPGLYVYLLYAARMRSNESKAKVFYFFPYTYISFATQFLTILKRFLILFSFKIRKYKFPRLYHISLM